MKTARAPAAVPELVVLPDGLRDKILAGLDRKEIPQAPRDPDHDYESKLPSVTAEVLIRFVNAWAANKFRPVVSRSQVERKKYQGSIERETTHLESRGYLINLPKAGVAPSNEALKVIWADPVLKGGLDGLARQIKPNESFTRLDPNPKLTFLTVLRATQDLGVTSRDIAHVLEWSELDTRALAIELLQANPPLIARRTAGAGIELTQAGQAFFPQVVQHASFYDFEMPDVKKEYQNLIPALIREVSAVVGLSKGLTASEISDALKTQDHDLDPAPTIVSLVASGVLAAARYSPDPKDRELARLPGMEMLYRVVDPAAASTRPAFPIDQFVRQLCNQVAHGGCPCRRQGVPATLSIAEVVDVAASLRTDAFTAAQVKSRLEKMGVVTSVKDFKSLIDEMVNRKLLSRVEEAAEGAQHDVISQTRYVLVPVHGRKSTVQTQTVKQPVAAASLRKAVRA